MLLHHQGTCYRKILQPEASVECLFPCITRLSMTKKGKIR